MAQQNNGAASTIEAAFLSRAGASCLPIETLTKTELAAWKTRADKRARAWIGASKFEAKPGSFVVIPNDKGQPDSVLAGVGESLSPWTFAALSAQLPEGDYRIAQSYPADQADVIALGWALGKYRFRRYKSKDGNGADGVARLVWPKRADKSAVVSAAESIFLARDLINTPASDMGPEELAAAAETLAKANGAKFKVTLGEALLKANYPMIHAVGRASARAPRLIDFAWGRTDAAKVTLVGKGVCFDTGGLDLKSSSNMLTMKKDMAGAAQTLALAKMIMEAGLDVRLRVLIPAVENSVSGNAYRPQDILTSRKGLTVEVGNTDAEGRLVLADALTEAASEDPALILDFATLTGAQRIACGADLPSYFCHDNRLAADLERAAEDAADPLWRLPLFDGYRSEIESAIADLSSTGKSRYGGAIIAALFLERFVGKEIPWIHVDFMGWNLSGKPGRPAGGEAQGLRAAFRLIATRFA